MEEPNFFVSVLCKSGMNISTSKPIIAQVKAPTSGVGKRLSLTPHGKVRYQLNPNVSPESAMVATGLSFRCGFALVIKKIRDHLKEKGECQSRSVPKKLSRIRKIHF